MATTKLNIGCDVYPADGWVNVDRFDDLSPKKGKMRRPDIVASAWDIPLPSGSVDRIYMGHVLEHMSLYNGEVNLALTEAHRLLKPGGQLLALGPDVGEEGIAVYTRSRPVGAWDDPVEDFTPAHRSRPDWEPWTFFLNVHKSSGVGYMLPDDYDMGAGFQHQWSCTLESLWLAVTHVFGCEDVTRFDGDDVFRLWRDQASNGWTPIVSGAPAQCAVLATR